LSAIHARRSSRARGSVLVETVIVAPLLLIVLAFSWFVYRMHLEKLAALEHAREPAWATASFGCGRPGETHVPLPGAAGDVAIAEKRLDVPADFDVVREDIGESPDDDILGRPLAIATAERERDVEPVAVIHASAMTFRARTSVMCNETVEDGRLDIDKRVTHGGLLP
jgi:hypothetical protein